MKKIISYLFTLSLLISSISFVAAQTTTNDSWWDKWSDPVQILDTVAGEANADYKIQDTALDGVSNEQGAYDSSYKIANTLDSIRIKIAPYLQWMFYIGLGLATILIVYNGILLVTGAVSGEDYKKVSWRIKNIAIGICILTWFAIIVKLFLAVLSSVLN